MCAALPKVAFVARTMPTSAKLSGSACELNGAASLTNGKGWIKLILLDAFLHGPPGLQWHGNMGLAR